jgi:hypothetical protein
MGLENLLKVVGFPLGKCTTSKVKDTGFDWKNELLNAAVIAGYTFFSVITITHEPTKSLGACAVTAALAFFTRIMLVRNLSKQ